MGRRKKEDYLVFPIQLLQNAMLDADTFIRRVLSYCVCRRYNELMALNDEREAVTMEMIETYFYLDDEQIRECMISGEADYEEYKDRNVPLVIIRHDIFDYFRNSRDRDKELPEMLGYMALKSIIGKDRYTHTTNAFLKIRMSGLVSFDDEFNVPEEISGLTKYKMKKIKENIEVKYKAKIHDARPHGFFFSFTMTDDELYYQTMTRSMNFRIQERKEMKRISAKNIFEKLKSIQKNNPKNIFSEKYENEDAAM